MSPGGTLKLHRHHLHGVDERLISLRVNMPVAEFPDYYKIKILVSTREMAQGKTAEVAYQDDPVSSNIEGVIDGESKDKRKDAE